MLIPQLSITAFCLHFRHNHLNLPGDVLNDAGTVFGDGHRHGEEYKRAAQHSEIDSYISIWQLFRSMTYLGSKVG